jgi:Chromo (CHRromatin Organisation MOdifier) domain
MTPPAPIQNFPPTLSLSSPDLSSVDGVVSHLRESPSKEVATPRREKPAREKRRVRFALPEPEQVSKGILDNALSNSTSAQEYVVDKIVDAVDSFGDGSLVYRVRWLGYDPSEDTWEPEEHLPAHFIRRYWTNHRTSTPKCGFRH